MKKIRIILTGATGMVGEGLLSECLKHECIEKVCVIGRRTCGYNHPKLTEIILPDISEISSYEPDLKGYNACFYCAGASVLGKSEAEYMAVTYTLTLRFAANLASINPHLTFCYISGAGSDSTEKGRNMWTRIKGKTENALMKLAFDRVYNFRPPVMIPFLTLKPDQTYYRVYSIIKWPAIILKPLFPGFIIDLKVLTSAMINCALHGYTKNILETRDIKTLSKMEVNCP